MKKHDGIIVFSFFAGMPVATDGMGEAFIRMIVMHDRHYSAYIYGSTHDKVCQSAREIFGTPFRTDTYNEL